MQWRKNRVAVGAVTFLFLLGVTIWAVGGRDRRSVESAAALPEVTVDKSAVSELEITRPSEEGKETVVLSKVDDEWRVSSPIDAEADRNNVESALNRLADMQITSVAATRAENYPRLEVDDAQAVHVKVRSGDTEEVELWIGKYANGITMVRLADREEVFGVKGSVRYPFDRDLKTWRNRRVTQAASRLVDQVSFESGNGTFEFAKENDQWVVKKARKPIKDFDPKKVDGLVSTAARLTATGFAAPEVSAVRAGFNEPDATVTLHVAAVAEASDGASPRSGSETEPETITLEIGDQTDKDTELYLRRSGDETIYIISKYLADRLRPDASAFERSEPADAPTQPPPGVAPGQQPQLPPEVMKQLQEQIRQQQRQQGAP